MLYDSLEFVDYAEDASGFLLVRARLARTGVQKYRAGDPGLRDVFGDRDPSDVIRVYRDPDEVFSDESLESYLGALVTLDHPSQFVDVKTAGDVAVGFLVDGARREGDFVVARIRITDERAIQAIRSGVRELSAGYTAKIIPESGVTPAGEQYDARQVDIRVNHVAILRRGRCGPECRVYDGGGNEKGAQAMKFVDCGGNMVEVSDAAAIALDALKASHALDVQVKDARIESLEGENEALKVKLAEVEARVEDAEKRATEAESKTTPEALQAAAEARTRLIADAKTLAPDLDVSTLPDADIPKRVLDALDVDTSSMVPAAIDAAFATRAELAGKGGSKGGESKAGHFAKPTKDSAEGSPREEYMQRQAAAYKGGE